MKIIRINDRRFKDIVSKISTSQDSPRRYQIHITDLIYSLPMSFYHKIIIQEYAPEDYDNISVWMRGKGHEIGFSNMLRRAGATTQVLTKCGCAMGSIDLMLNDVVNEFTTTVAYPAWRTTPYIGKLIQLLYYMASSRKNVGKLKIFNLLRRTRTEMTWKVELTDEELLKLRIKLFKLSYLFRYSLLTNNWRILPRTRISWMKKSEEDVIKWMRTHPALLNKAWKDWRSKYLEYEQERIIRENEEGIILPVTIERM